RPSTPRTIDHPASAAYSRPPGRHADGSPASEADHKEPHGFDHMWEVNMRQLFKSLLGLAGTAALAVAIGGTAMAQDTLQKIKDQGYIRIGFANEAPYGYATPDGKLTGESPEVARAILEKMGITEIDGVLTEFGSLI